jgi:hypothetical protein
VFQEMGEGGRVGQVVDRNDVQVLASQRRPKKGPSDPSESVDPNSLHAAPPRNVELQVKNVIDL